MLNTVVCLVELATNLHKDFTIMVKAPATPLSWYTVRSPLHVFLFIMMRKSYNNSPALTDLLAIIQIVSGYSWLLSSVTKI